MTSSLKTAATGAARTARIERVTRETSISVEVNLDGTGRAEQLLRRRIALKYQLDVV